MAYSKKVVEKFENTLNNPEAFNVGRFDPKELNVGRKNIVRSRNNSSN